jgi:aspartate racemase
MSQIKHTLGLIGGTSWHSTVEYYRLINELVTNETGFDTNPPLILYSLNIQVMRSGSAREIVSTYLETGQKLQTAGAQAIVICGNTPHMVYSAVQPRLDIPIIHIADAAGAHAEKEGVKTVGLLGNRATMTRGFMQSRLAERFGIGTVIPDEKGIDKAHHYVANELTLGTFSPEAKAFFKEQMQRLRDRGAEGIILGCTELPMLLGPDDFDLPMFPTTQLHAQMAADFILGKLSVSAGA